MGKKLIKKPQGRGQTAMPHQLNATVSARSRGHIAPQPLSGNHTMLRQLATPKLQAKLTINQPGDVYEQEADRVAEQVMRMPEPSTLSSTALPNGDATGNLQRKCACGGSGQSGECDECRQNREALVQRRATQETGNVDALQNVYEVLRSPGQSLDSATRGFFEIRFGHDFSDVRIHTDDKAAESAKAVNALAYTAGRNVVFASNQYAAGTHEGRRLLAHELTHVVQQADGGAYRISRFNAGDVGKIDPSDGANPDYTFSNNCGWIDWTHVSLVTEATDLIERVRKASASLSATGTGVTPTTGELTTPQLESHPGGVVFDSANMRLKLVRALSDEKEILGVSLSIWKKLSMAFETNQEWSDSIIWGFGSHTSFSQEDLPSNLIAFYMAAIKCTREDIAGSWRGGVPKEAIRVPPPPGTQSNTGGWSGRTQKGGWCDALDRAASKAEYDKNPFLRKKNRDFSPVGATGAWPTQLSTIKERDDLYEITRIRLTNPSHGFASLCPMYRLEGGFFTAAENVLVVPTYRFKQPFFQLGVPDLFSRNFEIEPFDQHDIAAFIRKNYKSPRYIDKDDLICLSSLGNPA